MSEFCYTAPALLPYYWREMGYSGTTWISLHFPAPLLCWAISKYSKQNSVQHKTVWLFTVAFERRGFFFYTCYKLHSLEKLLHSWHFFFNLQWKIKTRYWPKSGYSSLSRNLKHNMQLKPQILTSPQWADKWQIKKKDRCMKQKIKYFINQLFHLQSSKT